MIIIEPVVCEKCMHLLSKSEDKIIKSYWCKRLDCEITDGMANTPCKFKQK